MASCNLCASLSADTKLEYNVVLAKEHAQAHFRQLRIIDEEITLDQIFEKCFPKGGISTIRSYKNSSEYQSLAQLCRSLFSGKPPSKSRRRILCKICNSEKAARTSSMIIDHACSHLRLDLYECRICARQFSTKTAITTHLAESHRLGSSVAHFNARLDDFAHEISIMIKECFSAEQIDANVNSLPRVFTGVKVSDLGSLRQTYCQRLIKKFCDRNGNVQCRLCAKGIKAKNKDGFTSSNILDHAFRHLQKPIVRCKICSDGFSNSSILVPHLRKVHALPLANNYERHEDQFHDDIMDMLRKCYSNDTNDANGMSTTSFKSEASALCTTARGSKLKIERRMHLYGLCRKFVDREGKMKCKVCGMRIKAKDAKGRIKSVSILHHALTHLTQRALNRCKICSLTFLTNCNTMQHLRVTHALPLADNYEDLSDLFHHEILDVVRRCYDVNANGANAESAISCTSEPKIRNPVKGSKLAIERQALCVRLIKKHLDRDGKINCRLCSNRIQATKQSGCYLTPTVAMHALTHARRSFYRCKLCSKAVATRQNMRLHLKKAHDMVFDKSKYECLEDQFHSEIVDTLRKCYGNEEETASD